MNFHMTSPSVTQISNQIINVVAERLESMVQETVMKAMAEVTHAYFPKIVPNLTNDTVDISKIVIPPTRLYQLRTFIKNSSAQFTCPEQAALLELMLLREDSVLAVLGTGSGKTLVILLQASLHTGGLVTIVILPLSSLHDDLKRRASSLGVSYSQWAPNGKFNPNVCVISVSIEHLGFPEFIRYVYRSV
jgi:superfamily II DNA helicase RecQ